MKRMFRGFFQAGGASPLNDVKLFGAQMGAGQVTGVTRPVRGGVTNVPVFNPYGPGWFNAGSVETAAGFGAASLSIKDSIGGLNLIATMETCPVDLYLLAGTDCDSLGDYNQGYKDGYVRVLSQCILTDNVAYGDGVDFSEDAEVMDTAAITIKGVMYDHVQKYATQLATANAADLSANLTTATTYGNQQLCANCGLPNDGTSLKYWATASTTASPGAKPDVIYSIRGGTPVSAPVNSAAVSEDIIDLKVVGPYLVALTQTGGGSQTGAMHYALIGASGAPGSWTKVVAGFVGGKQPTNMLVLSPTEVFISANGGYVYKSSDVTQGVTVLPASGATTTSNLVRINGNRTLMVAVGAAGAIIVSYNGGDNWAAVPVTPPASNPTWQSVEVVGKSFFVGSLTTGQFWYTPDGTNWYQTPLDTTGTISDVYFVNQNEGYFLFNPASGNGRIYNTFTGGKSWWNIAPAIEQLGGFTTLSRIAAPTVGNESLKANNFIVAGVVTGTQGLLLSGSPRVF